MSSRRTLILILAVMVGAALAIVLFRVTSGSFHEKINRCREAGGVYLEGDRICVEGLKEIEL